MHRLRLHPADVLCHPQRQRHDRQRRVHAARAHEHRAVAQEQVVDLVDAAERVGDRMRRVGPHARRPHDVRRRRLAGECAADVGARLGRDPHGQVGRPDAARRRLADCAQLRPVVRRRHLLELVRRPRDARHREAVDVADLRVQVDDVGLLRHVLADHRHPGHVRAER